MSGMADAFNNHDHLAVVRCVLRACLHLHKAYVRCSAGETWEGEFGVLLA